MNSKGSANLSVRIGMDTDKENVDPLQDLTANVRGAAITAMAAHVDGLAKSSKKRSRGAKSSNSEKIEMLYQLVDNVKCLFLLVYDVSQYLLSTSKNSLTDRQQSLPTNLAIDVLQFVLSEGKHQLKRMQAVTNNTKAKSRAAQSHNKLTKSDRQLSSSQEIQRRVLAPTNPRKMLIFSLKSAKSKLKIDKEHAVAAVSVNEFDNTINAMAPRVKRRQLTSVELDILHPRNKRASSTMRLDFHGHREATLCILRRKQYMSLMRSLLKMSSIVKMYIIQNDWYLLLSNRR